MPVMKTIAFLLLFYCAPYISSTQPLKHAIINPTGTYVLKGEKHKGEIKGNFGEVRVKLLTDSLIAITMYCNKGFPDYSHASFYDTVLYGNNKATYLSKDDASCRLIFDFEADGLYIKQIYTDPASTCGFESGVIPLGYIQKYSSDIPVIQAIHRSR